MAACVAYIMPNDILLMYLLLTYERMVTDLIDQ